MITRTRHTLAAVAATLALGAGGLLTAAAPATAAAPRAQAPAALSCTHQLLTGSGGHKGAAITCQGSTFTGVIDCKKGDLVYRHFGNRAASGGTSTVWCDLGAQVVFAGGTPS
ncbi:hypothetical protein [Streptomyces corynorhini]|uniref:Secreted protein n=1 Tax=Streptomyces corynorhini TaxID=2282652 RepID=A0A370BBL3_9ACTN|nr:hypothetical protein [Streptomyces corynorhini]RDG39031.1 hypothetical protein DVH02_06010 [Streptomyces corynorhini]